MRLVWGHRAQLLGQGPILTILPLCTLQRGTSTWPRAALGRGGVLGRDRGRPMGVPHEGRPGRGRVYLSAPQLPPLPPLLLDGARGGSGRAGNHRGCHRSHFLPHTRKGEGLTASSRVGVGAGQDGSQLCLGGWISPSISPATHTLVTHSAFSQGMRAGAMVNGGEEER